eukprot:CAMPEP_0171228430 /NCGR_PEP_ID=MMETSP0790-20130122/38361_1 /TAXON_ID=2925 /ORGANISM="Alexandrium catenella, Strain OF101" /LENGTH=69 /DNA_ID=CAMNT_0011694579 /DNA_START=147 /DNA_END=352 /DNA_ORIENTATION=+
MAFHAGTRLGGKRCNGELWALQLSCILHACWARKEPGRPVLAEKACGDLFRELGCAGAHGGIALARARA